MYGYRVFCSTQGNCGAGGFASGSVDHASRLAEWAKAELLKEKVKKKLDARYGAKLDALADTIVDVLVAQLEDEEAEGDRREKLQSEWEGVFYEGRGDETADVEARDE